MGTVYKPTYKDRAGKKKKRRKWYIAYKDHNDERQVEPAFTDKEASQRLLQRRETEAARRRVGLPVAEEAQARRPLAEVEGEYLAEMDRLERSQSHRKETARLLRTVREACKWETLAQVRPATLMAFLTELKDKDLSPRTINSYRDAAHTFLAWCVEQNHLAENPLAKVRKARTGGKKRKPRRAYTLAELQALTAASPAHRLLYLVAGLSGLRRGELAKLEKRDLTPEGEKPAWHLRPEIVKGRRKDVVPMLPECRELLAPLWRPLASPTARIFPRMPRTQTLHKDLRRAKIERVDGEGRCLDFHSLRYFFCREMAKRLPIVKVQRLMRHKDIRMTANLYADLGIEDLGEDVWSLPTLLKEEKQPRQGKEARPKK